MILTKKSFYSVISFLYALPALAAPGAAPSTALLAVRDAARYLPQSSHGLIGRFLAESGFGGRQLDEGLDGLRLRGVEIPYPLPRAEITSLADPALDHRIAARAQAIADAVSRIEPGLIDAQDPMIKAWKLGTLDMVLASRLLASQRQELTAVANQALDDTGEGGKLRFLMNESASKIAERAAEIVADLDLESRESIPRLENAARKMLVYKHGVPDAYVVFRTAGRYHGEDRPNHLLVSFLRPGQLLEWKHSIPDQLAGLPVRYDRSQLDDMRQIEKDRRKSALRPSRARTVGLEPRR